MSKPDEKTRLRHMLESAKEAVCFLGTMSEDELRCNRMALQAIVRNVEIIGEAASQIPESFRTMHPEIQWQQIVGMRHRLIHGYFEVDHEIVYSTVHNDLPPLIAQLERLF